MYFCLAVINKVSSNGTESVPFEDTLFKNTIHEEVEFVAMFVAKPYMDKFNPLHKTRNLTQDAQLFFMVFHGRKLSVQWSFAG